jgi:hypothetical protein
MRGLRHFHEGESSSMNTNDMNTARARTVTVVDALMGSGKTYHAIEMMRSMCVDVARERRDHPAKRFVFITPFLDEAQDEPRKVMVDVAGRFTARITFRRFHYKRGKMSKWFWTARAR